MLRYTVFFTDSVMPGWSACMQYNTTTTTTTTTTNNNNNNTLDNIYSTIIHSESSLGSSK